MAATKLFGIRVLNSNKQNPFVTGAQQPTVQGIINFFRGLTSQKAARTVIQTSKDQVAASATLVSNGLTAADVAGASINGVDATATFPGGGTVNDTLTLIKNKINNGGDTQSALVSKAVSATRYFTDATGFFTLNGATGSVSPKVGGTTANYTCTFTATGDNAVDAAALAGVINAKAGSGLQVFAYSDGVNKCYVKASGNNRASITISSGSGSVGCRINGIQTVVTWATSDAATATALAAAINANTALAGVARAVNSASGEVTVISAVAGDQMPAIGAFGTGLTVGGTASPKATITVSSATGTLLALVNGLQAASVTAVGVNATDAAALAAAINASPVARGLVTATVASNVITLTSVAATTLQAIGSGVAASSPVLVDAGTYGGVAGNVLTLTNATLVTRSAPTLSGGVSGLLVTASEAGVAGNWITFAAAGAAAAHVTASGARLSGGLETVQNFVYA